VLGLDGVTRETRWLIGAVATCAFVVLLRATVPPPTDWDVGRLLFWTVLTLLAAALPVKLPGNLVAHVTTAPIMAAVFDPQLPQPFAVCWVALIGTIEPRDLRRELVWYGTVYNRANYVLSAFAAWVALRLSESGLREGDSLGTIAQIALAGGSFALVNNLLTLGAVSVRDQTPISRVWSLSVGRVAFGLLSQVPLGWLMAEIANSVGYLAALLFVVPLLLARFALTKYTETRELFLGSVSALSQAIDAKDGFTRGHADRVSRIAGAIAREMGLAEKEIEHIELAGLLHDIGKIGVEDKVLMKPSRLDPDEIELMRRHPIYGASILEPSVALRPLVPLVLHHHENYDGTGYPEGLTADDIPLGSRIIIVADAYEAMTSDRIYRRAIGHERAMEQLSRYKGVQFDPRVVRALDLLLQRRGTRAFETSDLPPINYETLAELRRRLSQEPRVRDASHAS
jgi:HD-GYP domain-containing protein (c-di-GMP phosphodiesterase class II)